MPLAINDRVDRHEALGDNNDDTLAATVVQISGTGSVGINYDERQEPGVVHGWWPADSLTKI